MKRVLAMSILGVCVAFSSMAQTSNNPKLLSIVEKLGEKLERLIVQKDLDGIVDMYGENAEYLPDGVKIYTGKSQIREYWAQTFKMEINDFQMETKTVGGTKKLIYETGLGISKYSSNGQSAEFKFKYVNVWELQKGGEYKLIVDIFNRDVPGQ